MSLVKTWYQPQLAADKFGINLETILQWVADGLVRSEEADGEVVQVNIDDVKLEVEAMVREP
jgi:predicted site-specific integrase-resolvase